MFLLSKSCNIFFCLLGRHRAVGYCRDDLPQGLRPQVTGCKNAGNAGFGRLVGYDVAVANMEVGQSVDIHLTPDEAYGHPDPRAIFTVEISQLPASEDLKVGENVRMSSIVKAVQST